MGIFRRRSTVQELVDRHYILMYRYAYRLTGSSAEAEDLTQEAFYRAQLSLSQLRDPGKAKAWLIRILRNLFLHKIRVEKRRPSIPFDEFCHASEAMVEASAKIDPSDLQEALDELPEWFRTPIILYYFKDFSYKDIAEQMDVPIGTVMSRLARAKAHLRARLLVQPEETAAGRPWRTTDGL